MTAPLTDERLAEIREIIRDTEGVWLSGKRQADIRDRSPRAIRELLAEVERARTAEREATDATANILDFNADDEEDCDACASVDDYCPFHKGKAHGELVMIELVRFVADESEGMWHAMRDIQRRQKASAERAAAGGAS